MLWKDHTPNIGTQRLFGDFERWLPNARIFCGTHDRLETTRADNEYLRCREAEEVQMPEALVIYPVQPCVTRYLVFIPVFDSI